MNEFEENQWNASYRKVAAVEELSTSNWLLDVYVMEYTKTYRAKPVWDMGGTHRTLIQDIRKMCETSQINAEEIIKHFFKMKDEYRMKGHTLAQLKTHIGLVNIDYQQRSKSVAPLTDGKVVFLAGCSKCEERNPVTAQIVRNEEGHTGINKDTEIVCDKCQP